MQVLVEISEERYKDIQRIAGVQLGSKHFQTAEQIIANGTPLPKGHGRLIDADELKKHKYHDSDRHENAVSVAQIDWQPTIIEADKAESEDKE